MIKEPTSKKSASKKKSQRAGSSSRIPVSKLDTFEDAERPSLNRFDTMPDVGDEEPSIFSVKHSK